MRYLLLNETQLVDLDQFFAFEVQMYTKERAEDDGEREENSGGYIVVCHHNDYKTIFNLVPKVKAGRDYCIVLLEKISLIRCAGEVLTKISDRDITISLGDKKSS